MRFIYFLLNSSLLIKEVDLDNIFYYNIYSSKFNIIVGLSFYFHIYHYFSSNPNIKLRKQNYYLKFIKSPNTILSKQNSIKEFNKCQ